MGSFRELFQVPVDTWKEIIITSFLIPVVLIVYERIKKWYREQSPARQLLSGCDTLNEVLIYLSQLSAGNTNGINNVAKDPNQLFIALFPNPLPTDRHHLGVLTYQNIDPLWSESDGRTTADVFNILGRIGKTDNVRVADTIKDWDVRDRPIFSIGFNPKTHSLVNECEPIYYKQTIDKLKIEGHSIELDAVLPNDGCIIQKTFFKKTQIPVFILAGHGTQGTETAGLVLSKHFIELGKLYGDNAFSLLVRTDTSKGKSFYEIMGIFPKPNIIRILLYPVTYIRWFRKNVFPTQS